MKLEIELDLNNIDYDAINKQIAEKVAAINIKETYEIDQKIDHEINAIVKKEVDAGYNKYLDRYWADSSTSEGRGLIQKLSREEIERRTKEAIDTIFTNEFDESAMREIMVKMIPLVFTDILFNKLENSLVTANYQYRDITRNMIMQEVEGRFIQR